MFGGAESNRKIHQADWVKVESKNGHEGKTKEIGYRELISIGRLHIGGTVEHSLR